MKRKNGRISTGKGRYGRISALLTALLAASLIALNIGAAQLEKRYGLRMDFSFNSISTTSGVTKDTLAKLAHPVHIYALFRKGNEDAPLNELLDRYAAASSLVTWEQLDPSLNPGLISRFSTSTDVPGENYQRNLLCDEGNRSEGGDRPGPRGTGRRNGYPF